MTDPGLTIKEMKRYVRSHFEDFVNRKQSQVALRNFSLDFLDHDEPGGAAIGPEAAKKMMEAAYARWPDLHVSIEDMIAEGDTVMVRNSWTATEVTSGRGSNFTGLSCGDLRTGRLWNVGQQ